MTSDSQARPQLALLMDFENVIIGLEHNNPDAEKPFRMDDVVRYLERGYGPVVYRKAFADWGNSKFRKYAPDLQRAGVEMQHVVRQGYNAKNAADTYLVIQAMDCVLHYPAIDTYVIVTGDADFLPLIIKLKATGKRIIGLGTQGTIANTLLQNCDEYIYYGADGLKTRPQLIGDAGTVMRAVRALLLGEPTRELPVAKLGANLRRELPHFDPKDYGASSLAILLESFPDLVRTSATDGAATIMWVGPEPEEEEEEAEVEKEKVEQYPFNEYMRASRWFIPDAGRRDALLTGIYNLLSADDAGVTVGELRDAVDSGHDVADKQWYGTLFSLTYGGCVWENPETSELPVTRRNVKLFRGVGSAAEFITRYYCSLLHKANAERNDVTAAACSKLLYPDAPAAHESEFEEVLQRLARRQ